MSQLPLKDNTLSRDLAQQIRVRGLRSFALLTLEAGRPLALVFAQLMWLTQPILALAYEPQSLAQWARFLEEPGSIDVLIKELQSEE